MKNSFLKKYAHCIVNTILAILAVYAIGRLYFTLTDGFAVSHIVTDWKQETLASYKPSKSLDPSIETILRQSFYYLGKGCQSYVFISEDKRYVIKFLKYQRFRVPFYIKTLSFLEGVDRYRIKKTASKKEKLDALLNSWVIAYEILPEQTGVVYLHLKQDPALNEPLQLVDKLGMSHSVSPNEVVFLVQKSAKMLCDSLAEKIEAGKLVEAKAMIDHLMTMLILEYKEGYGDNDHALMQNTGVIDGKPVHIDVGQLVRNERFKEASCHNQELVNKTYQFRVWLAKMHPELERHLTHRLRAFMGADFDSIKPKLKTIDEGVD